MSTDAPDRVQPPVSAGGAHSPHQASALDHQLRSALTHTHAQNAHRTQETFKNEVDTQTILELLVGKGIVGLNEVQQRRELITRRIEAERSAAYDGPTLYARSAEPEPEPTIIDCETRHEVCGSACCGLYNVFLTAEDVGNRHLLWDLMLPYRLMRAEDGYCTYLDRTTHKCTNWEQRPYVCRHYSCRSDTNIWQDFDARIGAETVKRFIASRIDSRAATGG